MGYKNVYVEDAGKQLGSPQQAPFDRIIVTAGSPALPLHLLDLLVIGGRMVIPIGAIGTPELVLVTKSEIGHFVENLGACALVPLIGRDAWPPELDYTTTTHSKFGPQSQNKFGDQSDAEV
ncbi:MAG TPA: hypothetical protein EYQ82_00915 [Dehalococcoidia bacterium]|nr:hypothetical protein [Dehalococcoidia bacterium]HIK97959.1 hypothetical protein [Dehalococcoidia bacterium]